MLYLLFSLTQSVYRSSEPWLLNLGPLTPSPVGKKANQLSLLCPLYSIAKVTYDNPNSETKTYTPVQP